MINTSQPDGLGRQGQACGEVAVLGAGLQLTAGMVVRGHKAGSPGHQYGTQNDLGIHRGARHAAPEQGDELHDAQLGVQH